MERRIEDKRYISYYEAKLLMERRIEDSSQINSLQEKTWDFLKTFGAGESEKANEIIKKIVNASGVKESTAVMLLNMCPDNYSFIISIINSLPEEESNRIDEEKAKKIFEAINEFCGSKES